MLRSFRDEQGGSNQRDLLASFFRVFVSIESYRLGLGNLHQPGPGFLFFWTGVAMAILSIAVLVRAWTRRKAEDRRPYLREGESFENHSVVLSLFLYAFFMERLGFIPITLLLFIFLLGMIEKKKWGLTIL